MTAAGPYRYEIWDAASGGASGWIFNRDNPQPCELLFSTNGKTIFRAIAGSPQYIEGIDEAIPAMFDLKFDQSIWDGIDSLTMHTPDGIVLATIERHSSSEIEASGILHHFAHKSMIEVSGRFLPDPNADERIEQAVKLYSDGKLLAYKTATPETSPEGGSSEWFDYAFSIAPGKRLLDDRVYLTINDALVVACSTRDVMTTPTDPENYLVPLPIELAEIRSFSTAGAAVEAFDVNHYLGLGKGIILVFARDGDFRLDIEVKDLPLVSVDFAGGNLSVVQADKASENNL